MKDLKETISLMTSEDYKERFLAEYYQLETRYLKLRKMYENWDNLPFTPACSKSCYAKQLDAMFDYLSILVSRALQEEIKLDCDETITTLIKCCSTNI